MKHLENSSKECPIDTFRMKCPIENHEWAIETIHSETFIYSFI